MDDEPGPKRTGRTVGNQHGTDFISTMKFRLHGDLNPGSEGSDVERLIQYVTEVTFVHMVSFHIRTYWRINIEIALKNISDNWVHMPNDFMVYKASRTTRTVVQYS